MLDHNFMFEVLGDSSDNIQRINSSLFDAKTMSFGASYMAQRKLAGIYRYSCSFSDGVIERGTKYVFTVPYTYMELKHRVDFKQSQYYKREIPYDTILRNPEMFQTSILMYIGGKLFTNFYVKFMEDMLQISFKRYVGTTKGIVDGFTISEIQNMQSMNVTFVFLPLSNRRTGTVPVYPLTFDNNHHKVLNMGTGDYTVTSLIETSDIPMLLFYPKYVSGNYDTKFGYNFFNENITSPEYNFKFNAVQLSSLYNSLNIKIQPNVTKVVAQAIYPQHLIATEMVEKTPTGEYWFETEIKDTPIPTENILVYRETNHGLMYDFTAELEYHYPNIYKINSSLTIPSDRFCVFIFYNDSTEGIGLYHDNELGLYYEFINGILDKYKDGTVPEYIKNYKPIDVKYGIKDYQISEKDGLDYKIDKLRELIIQNPFVYSIYLNKYNEKYPKISRIIDQEFLDKRKRYTTETDIPGLQPPVDFGEDGRYLFSIRNSSNNQTCLFFVDNKFFYPDEIYYTDNIIYMYFPADIIKLGTKLEILFLYDISMAVDMTLDSSIANELKLNPRYKVSVEDLYVTAYYDDEETDYGYLYDGFGFYEKIDPETRELLDTDTLLNGEYYREITSTSFNKYDTVYILCEEYLHGKAVTIRSDKTNIFRTTYGEAPDYIIDEYINDKDKSNLQLYRDGRLMSHRAITFLPNSDPRGSHIIQANISVNEGENIPVTVLHSSEKYTLECEYHTAEVKRLRLFTKYMDDFDNLTDRTNGVYDDIMNSSQELIEAIESRGRLVDLTGMLSRPLSFEWFDIYMNGLKLTPNDALIIAPYKMIILLEDDYPDIDSFIVIDIMTFIRKHLQMLINPDWQQVTEEMKTDFSELVDYNDNIPLDADNTYNIRCNVMLTPTTETEGTKKYGYETIVINGIYT